MKSSMNETIKQPWDLDFKQRLKRIHTKSDKKKAIYVYEKSDTSTFRYRVYNICQALEYSEHWEGSYFFEEELQLLENFLHHIHIVIFVRTPWSFPIDTFFHKVTKQGIPTIFDVDDLVFNIEKIPLIMNTLGSDIALPSYSYWFSYVSRLWMMGKMCDALTSTNEILAEQLHKTFNKPSCVINNFLNNEQIEISEKIYNQKLNRDITNPNFTIGYFSGSLSHKHDFHRIAIEIRDLLIKYPNMRLEVVGYMEISKVLLDLVQKKQILQTPFVDFKILQKKIGAVDVNIVPLFNNEFTNCKSDLKFFEASIVGTITCATPTSVFSNSIQHAETGFLCQEGDWYATVESIFKKDYSSSLITKARDHCLKKYAPVSQCHNVERVLAMLSK